MPFSGFNFTNVWVIKIFVGVRSIRRIGEVFFKFTLCTELKRGNNFATKGFQILIRWMRTRCVTNSDEEEERKFTQLERELSVNQLC